MNNKTIIIPGIDNGTIPMNILPENLAGTMTDFYDRIFDRKRKTPSEAKWFIAFLIIIFGFITILGTVSSIQLTRKNAWLQAGTIGGCILID